MQLGQPGSAQVRAGGQGTTMKQRLSCRVGPGPLLGGQGLVEGRLRGLIS